MSTSFKVLAVVIISAILLVPVYGKVISFVKKRSVEERLGYLPRNEILKIAALDHKSTISEWLFFKAIVYYGGKIDTEDPSVRQSIEYSNIYRFIDASTYLDPYNMDAYYFAEATFTWELGWTREVNQLLERGLRYRTWDYYLPFFLGFNNFYFLKDYRAASQYMKQVALLTGNTLAANLAARFLYETGQTETAVSFLKFMIGRTWNEKVKRIMQMRLEALEAVDLLEKGMRRFNEVYHRSPESLEELVARGIIDKLPEDPYGGRFYVDDNGKIRTTSEFVLRGADGKRNKNRTSK
jgi:hypothetical protein